MWTRDEAHVLRWDDSCSLAPSYHADLIVVDRNPLECPIEDLPSTQMHAKLLGGECVHGKL